MSAALSIRWRMKRTSRRWCGLYSWWCWIIMGTLQLLTIAISFAIDPMTVEKKVLKPSVRLPNAYRVRVDHQLINRLDNPFTCVSLDWWPADKCDYDDCGWENSSLLTVDLDNPLLLSAIRALSPVVLRVGGSLADLVTYEMPPSRNGRVASPCPPFMRDASRRIGFRGGCLPWARWKQLLDFCDRAGCQVYFTVNALRGRQREQCPAGTMCRTIEKAKRPVCCTNYTGTWDSSNLRGLLSATAATGRRPAGLAFGNELAGRQGIEAQLQAREPLY